MTAFFEVSIGMVDDGFAMQHLFEALAQLSDKHTVVDISIKRVGQKLGEAKS